MQIKKGNAADVALLSFVRVITILGNFLSVAILSRALSLGDYGTYSAGNLIVSVASSATLLGFSDAANYYYNLNSPNRNEYLNTVFFLQFLIGFVCAVVILAGNRLITGYFNNPKLNGLYIFFAFRPMLMNMVISLQLLQTAVGRARAVAVRNVIVMLFKLLTVLATAYLTGDILTIFISLLIVDAVTVAYYAKNFEKYAFGISVFRFDPGLIKEILRFCIPMGIYILANSLMKDTDKLVIGYFDTAETLAIYSNCSAELPIGIVTAAFLTVAMPLITRNVQQSNNAEAQRICRAYLKVGYMTTTILGMACIVLAPEAIRLLYGDKYLPGKSIFIIYVIVDMIKFANTTIVLTAKGRTKTLMKISLVSLAVNAVLNVIMYKLMGTVGPALSTVIVSVLTTYMLLRLTANTIQSTISGLIDTGYLLKFGAGTAAVSVLSLLLRSRLVHMGVNYFIVLAAVGIIYCSVLLAINYGELKRTIQVLNNK